MKKLLQNADLRYINIIKNNESKNACPPFFWNLESCKGEIHQVSEIWFEKNLFLFFSFFIIVSIFLEKFLFIDWSRKLKT